MVIDDQDRRLGRLLDPFLAIVFRRQQRARRLEVERLEMRPEPGFDGVGIAGRQKTAYEIMPSLVGSEMCIRDSGDRLPAPAARPIWSSPTSTWATCRGSVSYTHLTLPTNREV